jgi:ABC-2 type transport system permease protein
MMTLLKNELLKTFLKWRTFIGFIAVGTVIPLVEIGLKLEGGGFGRGLTRNLSQDFLAVGNLFNGYFLTFFIMNSLWVHIPFLISLVAGDQLAGEGTAGTYRILLIRPPSRSKILLAKYLTTLVYSSALVTFLVGLSLALGVALFGTGDLIFPGQTITVIAEDDVLWRLAGAAGLAVWTMWCVSSLSFLLSSLVENAIGPIIGTMAVIIVFLLISTLPIELFATLRPYLFTTYMNVWQKVMEQDVPWEELRLHVLYLGAYSVGFFAVTWYIFIRKDVKS